MRTIKSLLASVGILLATTGTALAAPLLQDPAPVKVEVHTSETHTVWYTDPMWLAIGAVVVLLVIVLAVMASRNRDTGSNTTVVR